MITRIVTIVRGYEPELEIALADLLDPILSANGYDADDETLLLMVRLTHLRACPEPGDAGGALRLAGFEIDLPDDVDYPDRVLDELVSALMDTPPFAHAARFEDDGLQADLAAYAGEIFALEMKLRRALTFVYLHAYAGDDPYALLREENIQPLGKQSLKPEQMKATGENPFFHLTFSQYIGLNRRPKPKLEDLLAAISQCEDFEGVKAELARPPVAHADDASFLAGLIPRMESIETMRNCVAHNRRPSPEIRQNYRNALGDLQQHLDDYLETHPAESRIHL